ncbi:cytochrome P450 [Macrolepiota fuliginosa MF-IS2]|uniref:Cytochrome P450 n=1 Tax=Macrolepiota fuliginosa MF-IS2 TaxID=1400762 RepID=A0A9P6C3I0_9AGAR|nr:cytochrome P450 [Macrolepiota fuliginosa MF-IS2]
MTLSAYIGSGFLLAAFVSWLWSSKRSQLPLPPGPRKLPLIGNLLDFPLDHQWLTFAKWSEEHNSDVIHVEAAGYSLVILSSYEAMTELLDKRSSIYSSRAFSRVLSEMVGWNWLMVFMPYGNAWRERRRFFAKYIHPSDTSFHRPRETEQLHIFLSLLLKDPENFLKHIRHMVSAAIITMTYGIQVKQTHDPFIEQSESAIESLATSMRPGTFLADTFYWLRYIPEGLPGTGWKAKVRELQHEMHDLQNRPYDAALEAIANGTSTDSFVSRSWQNLNEGKPTREEQKLVKDVAGQVFMAGADSTVSTISKFFLIIVRFPELYKKAQAEVDRVLKGRLSEDSDIDSLPYLSALLKEVLRWEPAFPMGVFHSVTCDDIYRGYHIPADSLVVPNVWALFHNPETFPEPEVINPERFLKDGKLHVSGLDPSDISFGFGRRTCQGRHIAESLMFHVAASVLSPFETTKAVDNKGKAIEPICEYSTSLSRQLVPFECSIRPRSKDAANLICSLS